MARCPVTTSSHPRRTTDGRGARRGSSTRRTPELLEIPSRSVQLTSGDIVATAGLFTMSDGSRPSGQFGPLLRSTDGGRSWDDGVPRLPTRRSTPSRRTSRTCARCSAAASSRSAGRRHRGGPLPLESGDGVARRRAHLVGTHRHGPPRGVLEPPVPGRRAAPEHRLLPRRRCGLVVREKSTSRRSLDAGRGTHDLGRLDATADARRADGLRVADVGPGLARARSCGRAAGTSWPRTGASSTARAGS